MERMDRVVVFYDTIKSIKRGLYINEKGNGVKLPTSNFGANFDDVKFFSEDASKLIDFNKLPTYDTEIKVVNQDCLYAAKDLIDEGFNPVVINNASFSHPGGGVGNGSAAQEENLCRRTTLFKSIVRFNERLSKEYGFDKIEKYQYPLPMKYGAIYSPAIAVFKQNEDKHYAALEKPFMVDIITIAAIKHPKLTKDLKMSADDCEIVKGKIRTMLNLGLLYGNDAIVLGAFGCGAYGNPPSEIARLFKEVLEETNYANKYRKIVFAILDDGNSYRLHNPKGNFKPFEMAFK